MLELARPYVDFLILADRVESVNGKLYMMGGAWDSYTSADLTQPARFGIAIGVNVPWASTNEKHQLKLRIENADGKAVTRSISIDFQVGRPPLLPPGTEQRLVWAINGDFLLPDHSTYSLISAIDDVDDQRTVFRLQPSRPG